MLLRQASAVNARAGEIASLVDATADPVIGTTPNGVITSWNRGAKEIYGWKASEIVGRPLVLVVPPATRDEVARSMRRLAQGTPAIRHQAAALHRDGHEINVDLTVCPVFAAGRLVAVSTVARDISSQVRSEAEREQLLSELARQNEQLREFDRLKDEFVASVSHELRTPLTSIRGYLELMRDDQVLDEEHEGMLGIVDRKRGALAWARERPALRRASRRGQPSQARRGAVRSRGHRRGRGSRCGAARGAWRSVAALTTAA